MAEEPRWFQEVHRDLVRNFLDHASPVDTGHWQSLEGVPMTRTYELVGVTLYIDIADDVATWQSEVKPNLPWAEDQFQERISGEPLNPGKTFHYWPYYRGNVEKHKEQGKFSHTYMERFWPKKAGIPLKATQHFGIRFAYGDFDDLLSLLKRHPYTRQAYLPTFFPEDTGAVHAERIPCTLGYQFLRRPGGERYDTVSCIYGIRSCDMFRHFVDDVYMAGRLIHHIISECKWTGSCKPGTLIMNIGSLHIFEGELEMLRRRYERGDFDG